MTRPINRIKGKEDDWDESHLSFSVVARLIGSTRQNVYQRCKRGSIPLDYHDDGRRGVPASWVEDYLAGHQND